MRIPALVLSSPADGQAGPLTQVDGVERGAARQIAARSLPIPHGLRGRAFAAASSGISET